MASYEPEITTVSEKGQVVIPQSMRKYLGIKPKNRFLVYGEGDTIILKRIELPDIKDEWKRLKAMVDRRVATYGGITDEEINEIVQKYRHGKRKGA